ncbi:AAA family ATPase [Vibrio ruber]|uniref:AAA family ATPase n=1 Tax=Vibrio ruber TaxID=184755 RepID=UPI002892D872|nr:AAA family ATPase [Vibrio ruber]WNJ96007.1 AAA family ATPase [Vibrio ruber]
MELSVEGYKSISTKKTIKIGGLTILSGANSSGKSSFMQPFLILKQTIENHYDSEVLKIYGENAKLTDSSQIISKVPDYQKKSFSIYMKYEDNSCKLTYKYKRGHGLQIDSTNFKNKKFPDGLTLRYGMSSDYLDRMIKDDDFDFIKKFYEEKDGKAKWSVIRDKCFLMAELFNSNEDFSPIRAGIDPSAHMEDFVTRLIHVPGLRGNPERIYKIASTENVFPGSFEKYVASIISNWSKYKRNENKLKSLKEQLAELGLAGDIKTNKVDDTSVEINISRTKIGNNSDFVNIADVGFGVSQTLPVLVALLCAKRGQCVYIEQPEIHLHPKAQFKLAAIIVSAIGRGVNVIIETHSSILIRGIQISVVNKSIDNKLISLNWFTQDIKTGETNISSTSPDDIGAYGDWPEDFDDTNLTVEQIYLDSIEERLYE